MRDNLVRIPKQKHEEISNWYSTKNADFGDQTPRDWLRGKGWEERRAKGAWSSEIDRIRGSQAMKRTALTTATVPELIECFASLCVERGLQLDRGDIPLVNRLFDKIRAIEQELKARTEDQRHALIALYQHENMQVRVTAAKATLAVAPEAARKALEDIKASGRLPQSAEASSTLWALEKNIFKPT